ncbi:hypothetical protein ACP8HZ_09920 [Francisella noatunensis]
MTLLIRQDPIDPVDPVDPVDPIDPIDPIDPVDPVDPVDPIDPPSGDYQSYVAGTKYESGTIVSANGKLYKCKAGVAA